MITKTVVRRMGGSTYLRLPPHIADFLDIKDEKVVFNIQDEEGKHGKFISAWRREE